MAMPDHAILTAISWYPAGGFTELQGPLNDLRLVEQWLTDPTLGAVLPENIEKIHTPLAKPADIDVDEAPPAADAFDRHFKKLLAKRMKLGAERVNGRLYLYFSGHGFCNKSQDKDAEAALYCANATRIMYEHIFGTHYARIAKSWALFSEVVLIMDCCRDAEIARTPIPRPYRDTPYDELAHNVPLLAIYAVPKGGKAQERPIAERGDKVHGLLTHALFKLLNELPASSALGISATELRRHLLESWSSICGEDSAPRPEIYLPASGEIHFPTRNQGSSFSFAWDAQQLPGETLQIIDSSLRPIAQFQLAGNGAHRVEPLSPVIAHEFKPGHLALRMKPGLYEYRLAPQGQQLGFKVDGGSQHVDL
jgi:hypothetical protein